MNPKEKLIMARQLAKLGVDTIEAGFPASSPGDFDSVQQIGHSVEGPMIVSLCRTSDADIQAGVKALKGTKNWGIHTFIATSDLHLKKKLDIDRKTAVKMAIRAIEQAKKHTEMSSSVLKMPPVQTRPFLSKYSLLRSRLAQPS
jgi:2-isopropylmalate synthase